MQGLCALLHRCPESRGHLWTRNVICHVFSAITRLRKISSRAKVEEQCDGVRSMELLLRQQKSTGVLDTNLPPLMPSSLTSYPSLAHSVSGAVELRVAHYFISNFSLGPAAFSTALIN